jgi:hypothetical protein
MRYWGAPTSQFIGPAAGLVGCFLVYAAMGLTGTAMLLGLFLFLGTMAAVFSLCVRQSKIIIVPGQGIRFQDGALSWTCSTVHLPFSGSTFHVSRWGYVYAEHGGVRVNVTGHLWASNDKGASPKLLAKALLGEIRSSGGSTDEIPHVS